MRDAAKDIDEEIERLNSLVNDVLDVARPIRFDPAPADINAVCRAAVQAASAGRATGAGARSSLAPALPELVTDSERLRTVLVNLLTNAAPRDRGTARRGRHADHPADRRAPRRDHHPRHRQRHRRG